MEIVRNCSHYSATITAFDRGADRVPRCVIKASFDPDGCTALRNELEGIRWYAGRRGVDPGSAVLAIQDHGSFLRMDLAYQRGECGDLWQPIRQNYDRIVSALDHHAAVFGGEGYSHGDYSLENIVFSGDQVVWILDWESFTRSLPPEFDLMACVLEACYIRYTQMHSLPREDADAAIGLLRHVGTLVPLPASCLRRPAAYFREISLAHRSAFGNQAKKYPFISAPPETIRQIDRGFEA